MLARTHGSAAADAHGDFDRGDVSSRDTEHLHQLPVVGEDYDSWLMDDAQDDELDCFLATPTAPS